ncbi:MAG: hypothetical protein IKD52_14690 [Exiguobacterium sp.]|nr:hypothetical protein [Exiguobacterium sp.]
MNWAEYLENADEIIEDEHLPLDEKLVQKVIVRDKQRVKKWISTKVGWRVEFDKNHIPREVKISATEEKNRKLAQQKAKNKRKNPLYQKKRLKSFKKRDQIGLDYDQENPDINTAREKNQKVPSDIKGALKQKLETIKNKLHNLLGHSH